jgi:hypothetical protein
MKNIGLKYRQLVSTMVPVIMLALLITSISISAFHNHTDCANPDTCAICTFQVTSCTITLHTTADAQPNEKPIVAALLDLPERITLSFHTHIFASHAPPQFC